MSEQALQSHTLLCMVILIHNTNDPIEAIQLKIVVVFSNLDKAGVAVGVQ